MWLITNTLVKLRKALVIRASLTAVQVMRLAYKAAPSLLVAWWTLSVLESLLPVTQAWLIKLVVDAAVNHGTSIVASTIWYTGFLVVTYMCRSVSTPLRSQLEQKLSLHGQGMLAECVLSHHDIAPFEESSFHHDISLSRDMLASTLKSTSIDIPQLAKNTITSISMLLLLARLSPWLVVLILVVTIPQFRFWYQNNLLMWTGMTSTHPAVRQMDYCREVLLSSTFAKEVRIFGLSGHFLECYQALFSARYMALLRVRHGLAVKQGILALLGALGTGGAYVWLSYEAAAGSISVGDIALYAFGINQCVSSIGGISSGFGWLFRHVDVMEAFQRVKARSSLTATPGSVSVRHIETGTSSSGVVFEDVSFRYPGSERWSLRHLSLRLSWGARVALVGDNGAGKTTIVKLLLRMYDPTEGAILIDGIPLTEIDPDIWRRQVTGVLQDYCRYNHSVAQNISIGDIDRVPARDAIQSAAEKSGIHHVAEKFPLGYEQLLGTEFEGGTDLSKGQWQKLALARAFYNETARLCILDEPTAALDARSEYEIYSHYSRLAQNKLVVLVSHRFSTVKLADEIVVLVEGSISEQGSHECLLASKGGYANLYRMQASHYA